MAARTGYAAKGCQRQAKLEADINNKQMQRESRTELLLRRQPFLASSTQEIRLDGRTTQLQLRVPD
jgi:hypothetical protein